MFCPSCNTRNQFYHNYCYYCGHKLKEDDKSMLMVKGDQVDIPNDALETVETAAFETSEAADPDVEELEATEIAENEILVDEPDKAYVESSININHSHSYDDIFQDHDPFGDDNTLPVYRYRSALKCPYRSQKGKRSTARKYLKPILSVLALALYS